MEDKKDNSLINKIVSANNIVDVIGSYINLEHKGKNFFGVCPFHDDHSPSMSVSPEKGIYKCFSCGASGNVISFLIDYLGIEFKEAIKILADNAGISLSDNYTKRKVNKEIEESFKINELANSIFKNNLASVNGKEAREYLKSRNLDEETIKYFNIGLDLENTISSAIGNKYDKSLLYNLDLCKEFSGKLKDTFNNRIVFPIYDEESNLIGFTGRIYRKQDSEESKYLNTRETNIFRKGNILYNLNNAKEYIRKQHEIIICEGQMDAIRLHTIGINNVVSLSGTSITKEQIDLISKFKCDIILNLDQDEAGKAATNTIGDIFEKLGFKVSVIIFNNAKDSDELISNHGKELFMSAYKNKIEFINFKMDYLKKNKNLSDSVELSKYINDVLRELDKINDPILVELKIKEISSKFGISESVLRSKITKKNIVVPAKKEIKTSKSYNRYEQLEMRIIYLMLENNDVITRYENNLGYLITDRMTNLANEIVSYRIKNKVFILSDFITYTYMLNDINEALKEVMNKGGPDSYSEEELEDAFICIKKYSVEKQLDKLKQKLRETLDFEEKKKIAKKIENMKKEVLTW